MLDLDLYGVILEDNKHYYKVNFNGFSFYKYENSSLYYFNFRGSEYAEKNWGDAYVFLYNELIKHQLLDDKILNVRVKSVYQDLFSTKERVNYKLLSNGLYANCGLGVTRTLKMLSELLPILGVSLDEVNIYIKLAPTWENTKVNNYFKNSKIDKFYHFLISEDNRSEKSANHIKNTLVQFDPLFKKRYPIFQSIFLFESGEHFSNYFRKIKTNIISKLTTLNDSQKEKLIRYFELLKVFYYKYYS